MPRFLRTIFYDVNTLTSSLLNQISSSCFSFSIIALAAVMFSGILAVFCLVWCPLCYHPLNLSTQTWQLLFLTFLKMVLAYFLRDWTFNQCFNVPLVTKIKLFDNKNTLIDWISIDFGEHKIFFVSNQSL